jgi:hypothetical protein
LVEKWIPPSRSKTAEIGQKTEGILGVKLIFPIFSEELLHAAMWLRLPKG